MQFIDTHAHLGEESFSGDRDDVIARAARAGVAAIVEIADEPRQWPAAVALARARPQIRASLGLHPYYADQFSDQLLDDLGRRVRLPEVVAVGEIGLDYVKGELPRDLQRRSFEALLTAAVTWDMPAVIHCRGAYPDLLAVLRGACPAPPQGRRFWGVVHCFSGTPDEALACAALGFALGADGPVTYPKNDALRQAFRQAGVGPIVLETDSPFLPPQSSRGKRNEPAAIPEIAARLAQELALSLEDFAAATTRNARDLFRLQ